MYGGPSCALDGQGTMASTMAASDDATTSLPPRQIAGLLAAERSVHDVFIVPLVPPNSLLTRLAVRAEASGTGGWLPDRQDACPTTRRDAGVIMIAF